MAQKPSIPKGTRDFSPTEMARRNYIFNTIREVFNLFGFNQIETPAMENLTTLMGKYGEEGDKLLFKILNSGDYLRGADRQLLDSGEASGKLTAQLCEKGLRYDRTLCPLCRTTSRGTAISIQALPDTTCVACRPPPERPL